MSITYESHGDRGALAPILREGRVREHIVGHTLHGPHKDNLDLQMNGHSVRREASQGQIKTFFIAMKLAQFLYLKTTVSGARPSCCSTIFSTSSMPAA